MYADLHVHSRCSDGTMSVQEILEKAARNNVSMLSICDHECIGAVGELLSQSPKYGVYAVSGVEIEGLMGGHGYHILGYHFDPGNQKLLEKIEHNRRALDGMSDLLIQRMQKDDSRLSLKEFERFSYDPSLGGWKGLHYLVRMGVCERLEDAFKYYGIYGVEYADADFLSVEGACEAIRGAGGIAVLAHPGIYKGFPLDGNWERTIDKLMLAGIQGIECYYPLHSEELTGALLKQCRKYGLYVTAGCDDHGTFVGSTGEIGQNKIRIEQLKVPF